MYCTVYMNITIRTYRLKQKYSRYFSWCFPYSYFRFVDQNVSKQCITYVTSAQTDFVILDGEAKKKGRSAPAYYKPDWPHRSQQENYSVIRIHLYCSSTSSLIISFLYIIVRKKKMF